MREKEKRRKRNQTKALAREDGRSDAGCSAPFRARSAIKSSVPFYMSGWATILNQVICDSNIMQDASLNPELARTRMRNNPRCVRCDDSYHDLYRTAIHISAEASFY